MEKNTGEWQANPTWDIQKVFFKSKSLIFMHEKW